MKVWKARYGVHSWDPSWTFRARNFSEAYRKAQRYRKTRSYCIMVTSLTLEIETED